MRRSVHQHHPSQHYLHGRHDGLTHGLSAPSAGARPSSELLRHAPPRSYPSYLGYPPVGPAGQRLSPFLLLDFNPEIDFAPTDTPRGVGVHPHKGFETVTIAYKGSVSHHDSFGNSGTINPGDVQWMTAGAGLLHKEYHEKEYSKKGGPFEMVQLWINLPRKDKSVKPHYQAILKSQIPSLNTNGGHVNLIAGSLNIVSLDPAVTTASAQGSSAPGAGARPSSDLLRHGPPRSYPSYLGYAPLGPPNSTTGPAHTYSPLVVADIRLNKEGILTTNLPANYNTALLVIKGSAEVNGQQADEHSFVLFANEGEEITIKAETDATLLLLSGEPLNEPIARYGPFVMNTQEELQEALREMNSGAFGVLE